MRNVLFGVVAVFAVGCSNASSVGSVSSADKVEPGPRPDPCVSGQCAGPNDRLAYIDPARFVESYGRPDLLPEIRDAIENANRRMPELTPTDRAELVEALYAKLDLLAQK